MTYEQAYDAFNQLLDRSPDPTTLGAFFLANRWKGNTPTELAGFVDAMRERSVQENAQRDGSVDCGANYDGKSETALLGVGAGIVAAAVGTPVIVHSADRVPATAGVTYRHVLAELGIETDLPPVTSARMVDETGFGFFYAPRFNPAVDGLLDRRQAMGVRTLINTIETLANPANSTIHLGSFFHLSFANRLIETIRESRTLSVDRILMIQGMEGYDDLRPGRTNMVEWHDGNASQNTLDTESYGMTFDRDGLRVDDGARDSASITEAVLCGERDDPFADAIVLNAAVRIYAGNPSATLEDGIARSRSAIESGSAGDVLMALREFEVEREREVAPK